MKTFIDQRADLRVEIEQLGHKENDILIQLNRLDEKQSQLLEQLNKIALAIKEKKDLLATIGT